MIPIPGETRRWTVNQNSDLFGSIVNSRNVNLDMPGYVSLAKKSIGIYTESDDADLSRVIAITPNTVGAVVDVLGAGGLFEYNPGSDPTTITQVTTTNSPSIGLDSDEVIFDGKRMVSGGTTAKYYDGSWNNAISGLDANQPHPMCVVENRRQLAVGDGNLVKYYDTSFSLQVTLTLPSKFIVQWIRWRQNIVYIGTLNTAGGDAIMFITDGASTSAQSGYSVKSPWTFSGTEYGSSVAVLNSAGQLLRFNGGGFDELAALPVYNSGYLWSDSPSGTSIGKVLQRGMIAEGERLYINLNAMLNLATFGRPTHLLPNMPSGLWVFDKQIGLYHRAGLTSKRFNTPTATEVVSGNLKFSSNHGLVTGDSVYCDTAGSIGGLTSDREYFAIYVADDVIKLALSRASAMGDEAIYLTGSVGSAVFRTNNYEIPNAIYTDAGTGTGAVAINTLGQPDPSMGSPLLFGSITTTEDANTEIAAFCTFGNGRNVGSVSFARIPSTQVEDKQQKLFVKYRGLYTDADKILVKAKTKDLLDIPTAVPNVASLGAEATWTSGTTFTVDGSERSLYGVEEGDEVEFIVGQCAGYTAHISSMVKSGDTYTITIDEDLGATATEKSDFIIDNYKLIKTITKDTKTNNEGYSEALLDKSGKFIDIKLEMRGFDVVLEEAQLVNSTFKKSA